MDMTNNKQPTSWLFKDSKNLPMQGLFKDCLIKKGNSGQEFPCIILDAAGEEFYFSSWRADVDAMVKKFGKESNSWKGKLCQVSTDGKKLILAPIEQNV